MQCREQRISESVYRSHLQALYTDPTVHSLYLGLTPARGSFSTQAAVNYSESVVRSVVMEILSSLGAQKTSVFCQRSKPLPKIPQCITHRQTSLFGVKVSYVRLRNKVINPGMLILCNFGQIL